jgi:hypothetical protein
MEKKKARLRFSLRLSFQLAGRQCSLFGSGQRLLLANFSILLKKNEKNAPPPLHQLSRPHEKL